MKPEEKWVWAKCSKKKRTMKWFKKKNLEGQVQQFMPKIPTLWEAEVQASLEPRSSRPAWTTE